MKLKFNVSIELDVIDKVKADRINEYRKAIGEERFAEIMEEEMKEDITKALGYKTTDEDCRVTVKGCIEQCLTKECE